MDGRGRLAEPLTRGPARPGRVASGVALAPYRPAPSSSYAASGGVADEDEAGHRPVPKHSARQRQSLRGPLAQAREVAQLLSDHLGPRGRRLYRAAQLATSYLPRGAGIAATALLILGSAAYGAVKGDHIPAFVQFLRDARDASANAAGFRIATVAVRGRNQLADEEILAAAGITESRSLLFLDVEAVREGLEGVPWIAQASVRKFYPDHVDITLEERAPFAFWQLAGKLSIIAVDGTVLGPVGQRQLAPLPLVVGPGAAARAREVLAVLDRYPVLREQLRAAVLVAERRWNLKLKSGLDVRLPETGIEGALDTLVALDRDKKLLSRDLVAVDLRSPGRVTVRLSDEAAQAREQTARENRKKRKGGDA